MLAIGIWLLLLAMCATRSVEHVERLEFSTWDLAMNLNPDDGHVMSYSVGWANDAFIGTYTEALTKDYLNRVVWNKPVNYIAIVRHQIGEVDAVKVFRFKEGDRSMLSRFQAMNPGREVVTEGGPIQETVSKNALNTHDDPIFSVGGDLAFNWGYGDNGHRIVLTGGYLSPLGSNDDNTHGLGNDYYCNPLTGVSKGIWWQHEISNIVDCPGPSGWWGGIPSRSTGCGSYSCYPTIQGNDKTDSENGCLKVGPVYGNYAIYVSSDATRFPRPGTKLQVEITVEKRSTVIENEL